jgi:putative heme-binding domain-containing protein
MLLLMAGDPDQTIRTEAVRALGELGGNAEARAILDVWPHGFSPSTRRAAGDVLVTRPAWARALLDAAANGRVSRTDLSATAIRALATSQDPGVRELAARVIGKFRASGEEKLKLIAEKRRVVLGGAPDPKAGYEVAKRVCLVCHKLHGEGADVGPDLTGVGRSTLDALLANIIDPNQIIGAGYENVEVETRDGRTVSGRMVENTETRIRLLSAGPKEDIIAKADVASESGRLKIRVSELSVMPEGLEQMPEADFRNMIWYLLNPPQDHRPWTPALRQELIGDDMPKSAGGG